MVAYQLQQFFTAYSMHLLVLFTTYKNRLLQSRMKVKIIKNLEYNKSWILNLQNRVTQETNNAWSFYNISMTYICTLVKFTGNTFVAT